jgi:Tubulin/FtsZ family, GTPase domain
MILHNTGTRRFVEAAHSTASFLATFGLGGGTGSGLGSCVLAALRDAYPNRYINAVCVAGESAGDVPCSAMNACLAGSVLQVC